jgi:hypothetical protein
MKRFAAIFVTGLVATLAFAPGLGARLLPPSAEPMQLSYRLWSVEWTKKALQHDPRSPASLFAIRGGQCGLPFGKAWLLPASINGEISTRCRIPAGKLLVFPVGGSVAVGGPKCCNREEDLRRGVRIGLRGTSDLELSVDGRRLHPGYLSWTPLFIVDLPPTTCSDHPP